MDISTIGTSIEEMLKCPQCNCEYDFDALWERPMIYSSCEHVVCSNCWENSTSKCPLCLESCPYASDIAIADLIEVMERKGYRIFTMEDQKKIELESARYEDKIKELEMENNRAMQEYLKKFEDEKLFLENQIKKFETEKLLTEQLEEEKNRLQVESKTAKIKAKKELKKLKKEDLDKMKLFEGKIKELEMEKKAATELKEQLEEEKNRLQMESKTEKIKAKKELKKLKEQLEEEKNRLQVESKTAKIKAKKELKKLKKGCFSCNECDFLVAEYRSRICVDCGLSSGILTKENHKLRLNADTQQIEKENLMCVGCAIEGVHAGHQTVNYQQLKLEPISIEKKKANDSELAEKRDTVVNSQTMITVARLLQTARVELSKLSEETVNAVTWDEFNLTWNSADIELSRAHSITEIFLNVADDTEKSLEKVVAGLGAIRTGCKVFVKNSGKGDISDGANHDDMKIDCSASVITDASEWEALSDSSGKSDQKGEI